MCDALNVQYIHADMKEECVRTSSEVDVVLNASVRLDLVHRLLKEVVVGSEDHVGVHVQQAAVAVVRELVTCQLGQVVHNCMLKPSAQYAQI